MTIWENRCKDNAKVKNRTVAIGYADSKCTEIVILYKTGYFVDGSFLEWLNQSYKRI